ncbi:type III pantothenate kinase [Geovibrio ferrireducens]|jgi:type III pantothenate kinase|uniref:type III pantothenate kinase n=1 Tax=Geovibrio ferrireducens TaxID=46201 RepID=UPI002245B888|nr:type III pantothenate kinase [Geovibrio ferrireducens]
MILAVDIGNTNIVLGIFEGESIRCSFRLHTDTQRTTDEYASTIMLLLKNRGIEVKDIRGVIISSVVPQLIYSFTKFSMKYMSLEPMVIAPGVKTGMPIRYENPKEVGADRIVNSVAGREKFGAPLIVVDFGTATTFDVVNAKGEYVGGVICPGVKLSAGILHSKTAKLPEIEIEKVEKVVGKNTIHSLQSGIYYGYLSMLDGLLERIMTEEFGRCDITVVATGGLGSIFSKDSKYIEHYDPDLTLTGLRLIYEKNL